MELILYNYRGLPTVHDDIGSIEDIIRIEIEVVTGDEVATVVYDDYSIKYFDSAHDRIADYYHGSYEIYNFQTGLNLLESWKDRTSDTYDSLSEYR